MRKIKQKNKFRMKIFLSLLLVFVLIMVAVFSAFAIRKTISEYAAQQAEALVLNIINSAVGEYLTENQISYDDVVYLTRNSENNVSSLEINIVKINLFKSNISSVVANKLKESNELIVSVPLGTLFGNEYTLGLGPQINFNMQISAAIKTDFESNFYSAGINQVLHQILIKAEFSGSVIIPWCKTPFNGQTSVIAAQTVLVGVTPDAYTNVIENYNRGEDGLVGDIFDYSAKIE